MTKQVIPPPTPPHLAKGHNCQNSRCRSLRSGALQPTPPETGKKQRKGGEAHSRPHPRQADHARNPRIRCTGAAGNHPPPLRESTQEQRPEHTTQHTPTPIYQKDIPVQTRQEPQPKDPTGHSTHDQNTGTKKGEGPTIHYGSWDPPSSAYEAPY